MSRRYHTPDRTWSSDSHLLPAGIRHVPRSDVPPLARSEEPPVRPWQQGEPPRERPPQRVRFQDSYDDYDQYARPPPPGPAQYSYDSYDNGTTSRPLRAAGPSLGERRAREELEWELSQRARRELELVRVREEYARLRQQEELAREENQRREREERRRRESGDNKNPYAPPRPPTRAHVRRQSSPPVVPYGERLASDRGDDKQGRRSRSSSPPDRFIKAELYSDPESYDDKSGKSGRYASSERYDDAGPATAEPSGYEPQPYVWQHRPPRPPGANIGEDDNESDTSWNSSSDISGNELYDLYNEHKIYEFNPSHLSRKPSQDASTTLSGSIGDVSTAMGSGSGEKSPRGPSPDPSPGSKAVRPYRIYQSEYTGDGYPEGSHSVKLTAVLDTKRQRQPLFKWRHIHQTTMNFDELSKEVGRIGGLSDADNHGLNKLLSDVKKYSIKSIPTSKGSNVKHMEPGLLQVRVDADRPARAKNMPPRTATWLCIPYFSLQKYAGPLSAAASGSFPTRTLLQEQYSGVSAERDMQQAVCQTGHVPPGMCFHVAQMWCIVLDDSLLITCGTMPDPTEKGNFDDMIDLVTKPSQDPSSSVSSFIYVYYTEAVMYALPIDQCRSWFAFISHFHEFWPNTLKFTHRDRLVTAADWPAIFNLARLSSSKVLLILKLGAAPQPPARGVLKSLVKDDTACESKDNADGSEMKPKDNLKPPDKGKQNATSKSPTISNPEDDKFHVFSWLESFAASGQPSSQEQAESLRIQLQEIEDFLSNETNRLDRQAYKNCPEATHLTALTYLEEQAATVKRNSHLKRDFEDRVDVLNAAEIVFRFFLPLESEGPTVGKFWGAIHRIVQMSKPETSRDFRYSRNSSRSVYEGNVLQTRIALRELTQELQSFTNIISHAQPLERASLTVPIQLNRAWIYLILALAKATRKSMVRNAHFDNAKDLIKEGMAEVMQALPSEDLLAREVVLPLEIVSLLSLKLLQDTTGTYPNLDTIYSEYLNALDNEVATKPSERSFEHRINLLKQEATVINRVVGKQRRIFAALAPSEFLREPQTINLISPSGPSPFAPKKRALDEGDYYQSYQPQPLRSREYAEREQVRMASNEPVRGYSRAPTVHESYIPHDRRHWVETMPIDGEVSPAAAKEYYRLSPTRPGGFRDLLTTDCLSLIDRRYTAFNELFPYANYLQEYNKNKWEDTKDRQEQAIYAFTIVTVIFLPLSAVAGIFGMNTADVRDMDFDQWLYWATAVPVTVAVILLGLWWMGELCNAFSWLPGVGRRDGYAIIGGYGSSRGKKVRMARDDGEMLLPAVMVQRPSEDVEEDIDVRITTRPPGPRMLRQRSAGPGYVVPDEYTTLESGRQRGYQRPWAD